MALGEQDLTPGVTQTAPGRPAAKSGSRPPSSSKAVHGRQTDQARVAAAGGPFCRLRPPAHRPARPPRGPARPAASGPAPPPPRRFSREGRRHHHGVAPRLAPARRPGEWAAAVTIQRGLAAVRGLRPVGQALGQVNAVRPDPRRQGGVRADQQLQAARAGDGLQPPAARLGVRRAECAIDDGRAARQARGHGARCRACGSGSVKNSRAGRAFRAAAVALGKSRRRPLAWSRSRPKCPPLLDPDAAYADVRGPDRPRRASRRARSGGR